MSNRKTTFTIDGRTYDVCLWLANACQPKDMTLVIEQKPCGYVVQFAITRHATSESAERRYAKLCGILAAGRMP